MDELRVLSKFHCLVGLDYMWLIANLRTHRLVGKPFYHQESLSEKMEYSACREGGRKKNSESPTGIEPMTFRTPVGRSNH